MSSLRENIEALTHLQRNDAVGGLDFLLGQFLRDAASAFGLAEYIAYFAEAAGALLRVVDVSACKKNL